MNLLPVAVIGGGPVGLALALALRRAGFDCRVFDARPAGSADGDRRALALSHGSRDILDGLGVWNGLDTTPIRRIHVSEQGRLGRTLIEAGELGLDALGHVARAGALAAMLAQAAARAGVAVHSGVRLTTAAVHENRIVLHADGGRAEPVEARLAAWAEGGVESASGVRARDYGQSALVTHLALAGPPPQTAYERFTATGALALLPHGCGYAVVWSAPHAEARALSALDDDALRARLARVLGGRLRAENLGELGERSLFPLALRVRESVVAPRALWLGNAAQTLHPIAGQGFNLALRDVAEFVRALAASPDDPGNAALLARHARARRLDRHATAGFTDGLVRLFGADPPLLGRARGAGLLALDLLPAARRFLARRLVFGARNWP